MTTSPGLKKEKGIESMLFNQMGATSKEARRCGVTLGKYYGISRILLGHLLSVYHIRCKHNMLND